MNKRTVIKRVVQCIAACYGILGILLIVSVIVAIIPTASQTFEILLIVLFLTPGILLILAAYQNLRRFGENSIRSISAIIALTVAGLLLSWLGPLIRTLRLAFQSKPHYILLLFIPLVVAYILYSILSKKLIQLTQDKNAATQQPLLGDGDSD